jgi:pimeloyl-ACP methyl ester carboxylesterase
MGNIFGYKLGIDSIASVDDFVTERVFQPPVRSDFILQTISDANCETFFLKTVTGEDIHVFRYTIPGSNKLVIFSHGNASDVNTFSQYVAWFAKKYQVNAVVYDYPGYGQSSSTPSEENCYDAIDAVVNFYKERFDVKNIILIGQSLGTGITIHYAVQKKWTTPIVLISPYKSISRVVYDSWCSSAIDSAFSHNMFVSIDKVSKMKCSAKIYHGTHDTVIDISHGKDLYHKLPDKRFTPEWIDGANHGSILSAIGDEIMDVINH